MSGRDRFARLKALFLAAFDREPDERATYLDAECGSDATLRDEVDALLRHHDEEESAGASRPAMTERFPPGRVVADRYRIVSRLRHGAMGEVFRADDLKLGVPVALKVLRSQSPFELERLLEEVRLAREVSHPAVCRVFDVGEADGHGFLTMEYVEGEDLASLLRRIGRLPSTKVRELAGEICAGLAAAHARGVFHRDLKPANIMLDAAGRAHILDFGIAVREGVPNAGLAGTPAYMAPEQLTSGVPVTEQTDVYALGLVLHELLTGRPVFPVTSFEERVALSKVHPPPPSESGAETDPALEESILRALQPEPSGRPASVLELARLLEVDLASPPEDPAGAHALDTADERRHLTVMHCTLDGASRLSESLDPEAYVRALRSFRSGCEAAITRYDGHVAQYRGDGMLVYFGYPRAHEQDAERAVRAALDIAAAIASLADDENVELAARVGIHTGSVLVTASGAQDRQEMLALGVAPSLAGGLQAMADPGEILISEATHALVTGLFVSEDRGALELEGLAEPVRVHRVLASSGARSRLERTPTLTRFVGRGQELGLLLERYDHVQEGRGQVVLIAGEAGIGKSRLVHELRGRLQDRAHTWLECRTTPYTRTTPLLPVIELLERILDFQELDPIESKIEKLEEGLSLAGLGVDATRPLFADLLSLRIPGQAEPLAFSPQMRRAKTLEALLRWLLALAEKQPLALVVEDLHWADPSTLEWLGLLIEQCPATRLLLLLTFRPEFQPPWPMRGHLLLVALGRLARRDTEDLASAATRDETLPEAVVQRIAARSDGIPLFVEELARDFVESGRSRDDAHAEDDVPETLQDSLMARLDRLGSGREVAQLGAVLGREFPHELLEAVSPLQPIKLREAVTSLVDAELWYQRGLPPAAIYVFKHALVQDTAYQSLLGSERTQLHGRIADVLESRFPEHVARQPEEIAYHCERAGRAWDAIGHYQRAGERATRQFAHPEAITHLRKALELLANQPASAERDRQELLVQVALGPCLTVARGYGHPEVEEAYRRARALCSEVDEEPELVRVLIGLSLTDCIRGDLQSGAELAEQGVALAERSGDAFLRQVAHTRLGMNLMFTGEITRSIEHLELAMQLHDPEKHRVLEAAWGQGIGIGIARIGVSFDLLIMGYPDRAVHVIDDAIELAREGDPFDLAQVLANKALLFARLGEHDRTLAVAEETIDLASAGGFAVPLLQARAARGTALPDARGAEELHDCVAHLAQAGLKTLLPDIMLFAAVVDIRLGRVEDALAVIESALRIGAETGAHGALPLLNLVKGEILLRSRETEQAEVLIHRALDAARVEPLKRYELMASTTLARLLADRGEKAAARQMLQPVYDWFTEGFDTPDLKEAKALLEELAG